MNIFKEFLYRRYKISFSKSGEDILLSKILQNFKSGTYVDIGCWHPIKASNTYFFYLRGYKGICIDPNPQLRLEFSKFRKTDTLLTCGVGGTDSELDYYVIKHDESMNTFNPLFIEENGLQDSVKEMLKIPVRPLADILRETCNPGQELLFFDVDVEGYDFEVLQSNHWEDFRPYAVMVESNLSLKEDMNSDINGFLEEKGYSIFAKTVINKDLGNLIFLRKDFYK